MRCELLLGNEAVAAGAIDAGISGVFGYPGTPSTEIFETIQLHAARLGPVSAGGVSADWAPNEKVGYEEALGMSYAGGRCLVTMKHVGLNVAADPFINSALTGVNGGIVVAVADDPGMHSSQNEQDSRILADFAQVPVFEPSNQQEAYDLTRLAFEYSEEVNLPVVLRMVTRLSHSRANVTLSGDNGEVRSASLKEAGGKALPDPNDWTLVPVNARRRYQRLVNMQPSLVRDSEICEQNTLHLTGSRGVITNGIAYNYLREALGSAADDWSILKITRYPIPVGLVRQIVDHCDELFVVEEGYPHIERRLNGLLGLRGLAVRGKLSHDLPPTGELDPDIVAAALGVPRPAIPDAIKGLAGRPPQLCKGCPHADSFRAIIEAVQGEAHPVLFSDIGCYTLGVMPPYRAVHSCVDMGSSISMAHGASRMGVHPAICTVGDSTFGHSGMNSLLSAAAHDANITVFVLDNATTAMTGTQDSLSCGQRLIDIILGVGVNPEHVHVLEPKPQKHKENVEIIRRELAHRGLSVIIPQRSCIHVKPGRPVQATVGGQCSCANGE
ncbi:MAG: indolepyruvate ferredoxin oxidoreductase [Phycisphaeraceae bacterium]|nr:MAG: indolepyruvate ferredoxin oxidoreductase [Phycisphaeraceae bacterium]